MTWKEGAYEAHAVPDPRLALHAEDSRRTSGNMENTDPQGRAPAFPSWHLCSLPCPISVSVSCFVACLLH